MTNQDYGKYQWWPNAVTALFSPVNESLWEHVKLVFWPFLGAALLLNRERPGGVRPWLLVLPLLCVLTLGLGWAYTAAHNFFRRRKTYTKHAKERCT